MDYFLWKCTKSVGAKQLHLIGTACLMIASKNEEVRYIHVDSVLKKIAYDKFTKEELLETEFYIL